MEAAYTLPIRGSTASISMSRKLERERVLDRPIGPSTNGPKQTLADRIRTLGYLIRWLAVAQNLWVEPL